MRQEHLVKCRKVGAANWGTKTKKEEFELEEKKGQKCWPGYEKKGTQKLFGKDLSNRCVKKEEVTGGDPCSRCTRLQTP